MNRAILASILFFAASSISACGGPDEAAAEGEALSSRAAYFTAERDARKCAAPACGGWWLREADRGRPAIYVAALDLSQAGLGADGAQLLDGAGPHELLLYGSLRSGGGARQLAVRAAYRGQPNAAPADDDELYSVAPSGIVCITAPCDSLAATRLGTGERSLASSLDVERSCRPFADDDFLSNAVVAGEALVAARMGEQGEKSIDAGQIYLRLPVRQSPCPAQPMRACPAGQLNVWTRTAERCLIPDGCVAPAPCPDMKPSCEAGYMLTSWPAQPSACPQYRCDPSFLVPAP
jgi:hypothetical protein